MSESNLQALIANSYLSGGNAGYLEDLYESFLKDPNSVDAQWRHYFQNLPRVNGLAAFDISHADIREQLADLARQPQKFHTISDDAEYERRQAAIDKLVEAYMTYGHLAARFNPLHPDAPPQPPELNVQHYPDLINVPTSQLFHADNLFPTTKASLSEITTMLDAVYCGSIGTEFMYIRSAEERAWINARLIKRPTLLLSREEKLDILKQLTAADGLEKYLAAKYVGQKRFSLEGGDSFIPLVHALTEQCTTNGVNELVIGMAHRGRLSTLINIFGKPPIELFAEFEGRKNYGLTSGDVKYHLGYSSDIVTKSGPLHLSLAFNPSHLEIITPVMSGSVRARQQKRGVGHEHEVMALTVHGDASFAGQGVVMETLNMSQTRAYKIGGSVRIVINNQVGFTTSDPRDARSSRYCTDLAKMIEAPVLHVNGDDAEAVVFAARLAADYRKQFQKDIVIDLVCYRRLGHNEADEPAATQPMMYQFIRQHHTPRELYAEQLIREGVCTQADVDAMAAAYRDSMDAGAPIVKTLPDRVKQEHADNWKIFLGQEWTKPTDTSVPKQQLMALGKQLATLPAGFEIQRQVGHIFAARAQMAAGELPLDWGFAETLAYATLLTAGYPVRMSGEDCRRGTFSHRHATIHDQKTGEDYTPLQHLQEQQAPFHVYDSLLSEMATMGFEYGYACTDAKALVLWEAQYGDFANGAQVVTDQFISSAWQKWQTLCGLTLLLPHGYEGAGPEHTSARLERYLQLCAQENIQVCMPTTPAQIFHLLRRQTLQLFRAPLIVMTPKSMLRHKLATSTLEELSQGPFQLVIPEIDDIAANKVTRAVLCSGKVYYDLLTQRREEKLNHIAIIRVEQLYPFPHEELQAQLKRYKHAADIVWCQEEPENQGAWYTTRHRLEACLGKGQTLHFAGRPAAASPAAGYMKLHLQQQEELVTKALGVKAKAKTKGTA